MPRARASSWSNLAAGLVVGLAFVTAFVLFGGRSLSSVVAGTAALAALGAAILLGTGRAVSLPRLPALAVLVLLAWSALGLLPLPASLLDILSPRRAAIEAALPSGFTTWPELAKTQEVSPFEPLRREPTGRERAGSCCADVPGSSAGELRSLQNSRGLVDPRRLARLAARLGFPAGRGSRPEAVELGLHRDGQRCGVRLVASTAGRQVDLRLGTSRV